MRKLKYYLSCSLDGFIAREDGSSDFFLMEGEHEADYLDSFKLFDVVLMGRKTYEGALKVGVTDPYPNMKTYIFSRTREGSPDERVEIVAKNACGMVRKLKDIIGKDIWLCGGGELATTLFAENLIDEVILYVNPVLIGSGIQLNRGIAKQIDLEFINSKSYEDGVVLLHYRVKH